MTPDDQRARWRVLHPDLEQLAESAALLRRLPIEGGRCIDLAARVGTLAAQLEERGASEVWMADTHPLPNDATRRRFVVAEPGWIADHPRLREVVGTFDLAIAAIEAWRLLGASRSSVRTSLQALRALLQPGGVLRLVAPQNRAPRLPRHRAIAHDENGENRESETQEPTAETVAVAAMVQRLDACRHEWRFAPERPPAHASGIDLDATEWALELEENGFETVAVRDLEAPFGHLSTITGTRPGSTALLSDGAEVLA